MMRIYRSKKYDHISILICIRPRMCQKGIQMPKYIKSQMLDIVNATLGALALKFRSEGFYNTSMDTNISRFNPQIRYTTSLQCLQNFGWKIER